MAKVELKTKLNDTNVDEFIDAISDERQRTDARRLIAIFRKATGEEPKMWGPSIIGFGLSHMKYASGRELDAPLTAFSARKGKISLYIIDGIVRYEDQLPRLGKYKTGKGCLYINQLSDVDEKELTDLIKASVNSRRLGRVNPRNE